ncbi:MAG: S8 family serine peptidase [Paludibacteraceae bacterium]|nr:S8 family serine peptidase [Paludibacteraceae bacterium]
MIALLILLNVYFVSFADKPEKTAPQLSERAIEQRQKWNIPTDEMDYPVSRLYLDSLRHMGARIYHCSRWFNGATCEMSDALATKVAALRFVTEVEMTRDNSLARLFNRKRLPEIAVQGSTTPEPPRATDDQLALYDLLPLHGAGYNGQGILMSICDGGFYLADTLSCFRHALELGHFDFTDDTDGFYGSTGTHGTECLSVISAIDDDFYGAATQAEYYLMRAEEYATESPKEMDNVVAALEKSDSLGVNVFSISLGYYVFDNSNWDLTHADLDGQSTRVSQAATIAARKGMLVCAAAGNEANKNWQRICVPADADSVLAVGAVDTEGYIGDFSSYGPSADGRIKPDVCAVGVRACVMSPYGLPIYSNGTSFAAPLLAGLAATLWSALPNENAMQIRERIIRSADRYTDPSTDRYGYGIPDAWMAYTMTLPEDIQSAEEDCKPTKILFGSNVYILRHGHIYNLAGQMVR